MPGRLWRPAADHNRQPAAGGSAWWVASAALACCGGPTAWQPLFVCPLPDMRDGLQATHPSFYLLFLSVPGGAGRLWRCFCHLRRWVLAPWLPFATGCHVLRLQQYRRLEVLPAHRTGSGPTWFLPSMPTLHPRHLQGAATSTASPTCGWCGRGLRRRWQRWCDGPS